MELVRELNLENRVLGGSNKKFAVMEYVVCGKEI